MGKKGRELVLCKKKHKNLAQKKEEKEKSQRKVHDLLSGSGVLSTGKSKGLFFPKKSGEEGGLRVRGAHP